MLIHAGGATLNVSYVDRIWTDKKDSVYICKIAYYNGRDEKTDFTWSAQTNEQVEAVHKELLKQIREVELEKMSTLLEDAIAKA
jgi:hypothetical protein